MVWGVMSQGWWFPTMAASFLIIAIIFEVAGTRSALEPLNLDRHWRNAQTVATHNPIAFRARAIGDFWINGTVPEGLNAIGDAPAASAPLGADAPGRVAWWPDDKAEVTLAQIIAHVALDEARHAGHADILREQIDGQAGLRAPGNNLPVWGADRWAAHVDRLTAIAEGSGRPGRN